MQNQWDSILKIALTGQLSPQKHGTILREQLNFFGIKTSKNLSTEKILLKNIAAFSRLQKTALTLPKFALEPIQTALPAVSSMISSTKKKQIKKAINFNYNSILIELLIKINLENKVLAPTILPLILNYCSNKKQFKKLLSSCLGQRGLWLASLRKDWNLFLPLDITDQSIFEYGEEEERLAIIEAVRLQEPTQAFAWIQAVWTSESFGFKGKLLKILELNLSSKETIFLEKCLTDKRKNVRDIAAQLLSQIEDSPLVVRMQTLLEKLVIYSPQTQQFTISLPKSCTKAMQKDGVAPRKKIFKNQGVKASQLAQIIAKIPPTYWEDLTKKNPQELLKIISKTEWFAIFVWAWAKAALQHKNEAWILAIYIFKKNTLYQYHWKLIPLDFLNQQLPNHLFNTIALRYIEDKQMDLLSINNPLIDLLLLENQNWSIPLAKAVMDYIQNILCNNNSQLSFEWTIKSILKRAAFVVPPSIYFSLQSWNNFPNYWQRDIDNFLSILKFRAEI